MFWSKPCSLALAPESPLRVEEPKYEGVKRLVLRLMLFYSKQSKSIRGANVIYQRVVSQVDKPAIYDGQSFLTLMFLCQKQIYYLVKLKPKYARMLIIRQKMVGNA